MYVTEHGLDAQHASQTGEGVCMRDDVFSSIVGRGGSVLREHMSAVLSQSLMGSYDITISGLIVSQ